MGIILAYSQLRTSEFFCFDNLPLKIHAPLQPVQTRFLLKWRSFLFPNRSHNDGSSCL